MPLFKEDPAHLSKSRLKADLVAHNVELPPAKSKKEVLVELHVKHIDQKTTADFSSDEEDVAQDAGDGGWMEKEGAEVAEIPDPSDLTNEDLKAALLEHGFKAGPILVSTRALYEKKLQKLQTEKDDHLNGVKEEVLYSDSEEEDKGSEGAEEELVEDSDEAQQESSQLPVEPEKDPMTDLFPDIQKTPSGIYATRRKPIKGAAPRPIQYIYPDTPLSPTTLERREVERRLLPIHIQILVFLFVVVLLYLIYGWVEDDFANPFAPLLDCLNHWLDSGEVPLLQAEAESTPALHGQE